LSNVHEDTPRAVTVAGDIKDIVNAIAAMILFKERRSLRNGLGGLAATNTLQTQWKRPGSSDHLSP